MEPVLAAEDSYAVIRVIQYPFSLVETNTTSSLPSVQKLNTLHSSLDFEHEDKPLRNHLHDLWLAGSGVVLSAPLRLVQNVVCHSQLMVGVSLVRNTH